MRGIWAAAASAGVMLAAVLAPPGLAGLRIGWALPLTVVVALWGWPAGVAAAGAWLGLLGSVQGLEQAFLGLLGPAMAGLAYGSGLRAQKGAGVTLLIGGAALAAGLLPCLPSLALAWTQWKAALARGVESALELYRETGLLEAMVAQGLSAVQLQQSLESLASWVGVLYPALLAWETTAGAVVVYFAGRWAVKRWRTVPSLPPFSHWQLPWPAVWGLIFGLAAYLAGDRAGSAAAVTVGVNVMAAYVPVLALFGLAVLIHLYRHMLLPPAIKALVILPLVLYLPLGVAVLVTLGLFDPWLNFRRLAPEGPKGGG